jgi:hypothetical protein
MKIITSRIASFGPYALDLRSGELRKFGTKVKMGEQAFQNNLDEETIRYLEEPYRERSPDLVFLQNEPNFDFVHSDPRYREKNGPSSGVLRTVRRIDRFSLASETRGRGVSLKFDPMVVGIEEHDRPSSRPTRR